MASIPLASSSHHSLDQTHWGNNQPYRWQSPPPGAAPPVRRLLPPIPVAPSSSNPSVASMNYRVSSSSTSSGFTYYDQSPAPFNSPPPMYRPQSIQQSPGYIPPRTSEKKLPLTPFDTSLAPSGAYDTTPRGSMYAGADPPMATGSEWSPQQLLNEPTRSYPSLDLQWDTIFDARKHRVPVLPETWFQDGWELAGVYPENILFIERGDKKRRVQIYDIPKMSIRLMEVKYEVAVLSYDGKHLLIGYGDKLHIVKVKSEKSVKKFKAKNVHVRKWTSNSKGFCWVDTEGRFWRWSYAPGEEPEQLFKLISTAPKYWMTPIAAHDGSWYAVVASEKDRRTGVVHAFPENHGEARIFYGPAAAAFTTVTSAGMTEMAITMMTLAQEGQNGVVILDVQGMNKASRVQRQARANVTLSESMRLFPEVFIDEHSSLAVTAISTNATDGSLAMVFDPQGGKFVASRRLYMDNGDRIFCGTFGVHMERNASMFRRLKVHPDGPPNPDYVDAEDALFRSKSRRSSHSGQTVTDSGSMPLTAASSRFHAHTASTYATSVSTHSKMTSSGSSASGGKVKRKSPTGPAPTWGRGNFAPKDSDESWMFETQRKARWAREDLREDSD